MDLSVIEQRWATLLSADQVDFVQAYLVTQSVASASEMVGIKRSQGRRYLLSPTIQAAIKLAQKSLRENIQVTPEEIIGDLRLLRDMALGRIAAPHTQWVDGEPVTKYVKQFNPNAANKAVENLGRVIGSFTDKKEISMPATDSALKSRLEDLLGVKLDALDAEYHHIDASQVDPSHNTHKTNALPEPPETISELFEELADNELADLLAKACDEQGF